jgi:hypothetical protein
MSLISHCLKRFSKGKELFWMSASHFKASIAGTGCDGLDEDEVRLRGCGGRFQIWLVLIESSAR